MLDILPLAGHTSEVLHPSFIGLRPQSHFHCGLWDSAVSLFNLWTGLVQPCLSEAATNTICVSVGQKITQYWALSHLRRLCPCQRALACTSASGSRTRCWSGCVTWWMASDLCPPDPPPSSQPVVLAGSSQELKCCRPQINTGFLPVEQDFASRVFFWCDVS